MFSLVKKDENRPRYARVIVENKVASVSWTRWFHRADFLFCPSVVEFLKIVLALIQHINVVRMFVWVQCL